MSKQIRKQGKKAQRARAALYAKAGSGHWIRRIIKETQQSERTQSLVLSGALDKWLDPAETK